MVKFTNMYDSKGKLIQTSDSAPSFCPQDKRLRDLGVLAYELLEALAPFKLNPKTFDYIIQPYGMDDRLIWFSKVRLEGDSDLVKLSQTAIKNPDFEYQDAEQEATFKSIFQNMESSKSVWYLLSAETICLTRNMCDAKIIKAEAEKPIPYQLFMDNAKANRITRDELVLGKATDKCKYLAHEKDYNDVRFLFQTALLRSEDDVLDGYIQVGLNHFKKKFLSGADECSNEKTYALMLLNDSRYEEQYEIFKKLKLWGGKEARINGERINISYKNNCMLVKAAGYEQTGEIYICKDPVHEFPVFQMNGKIINGIDAVKAAIESGECFAPSPLWWDEVKALNKA